MDFETQKKNSQKIPFSEFAKFSIKLAHKDYFINGTKYYKWELWDMGYKNALAILCGDTDVEVRPIPENEIPNRFKPSN